MSKKKKNRSCKRGKESNFDVKTLSRSLLEDVCQAFASAMASFERNSAFRLMLRLVLKFTRFSLLDALFLKPLYQFFLNLSPVLGNVACRRSPGIERVKLVLKSTEILTNLIAKARFG